MTGLKTMRATSAFSWWLEMLSALLAKHHLHMHTPVIRIFLGWCFFSTGGVPLLASVAAPPPSVVQTPHGIRVLFSLHSFKQPDTSGQHKVWGTSLPFQIASYDSYELWKIELVWQNLDRLHAEGTTSGSRSFLGKFVIFLQSSAVPLTWTSESNFWTGLRI